MRLWSIHPKYLDTHGLTAAWREGLLAKKVLEGKTKGYTHHPQLIRFKACRDPAAEINKYLEHIFTESLVRGYHFDRTKISRTRKSAVQKISVTDGQIAYEFRLLQKKLALRCPAKYRENSTALSIDLNGLFTVVPGEPEEWEKVKQL